MKDAKLVYPDYCHEDIVKSFMKDICDYDKSEVINGSGFYTQYLDYKKWVKKEKEVHLGIHLDKGIVPGTTYLYMLEDKVIGVINIRHCLNDYLLNYGGHIGYTIHPDYRQQGFATRMLKEALLICQQWEIWPVLVTCNKENMASQKTIKKCGGVLENEYKKEDTNETILRFWIGE